MSFLKWFLDIRKSPKNRFSLLNDFIGDKEFVLVKNPESSNKNFIVQSSLEENPNLYRPLSFDDYIGQKDAKDYLQKLISGAKSRNKTLSHTLIYGPAGYGKTTLAKIIARELGVSFQEILSTRIEHVSELLEVFQNAKGGVIFMDEIHALDREMVEPLYPIMEDFRLEGRNFEPFTLIGATTEYGELKTNRKPFVDRFEVKIPLSDYNLADIELILRKYKQNSFPSEKLLDSIYKTISENCRLTPRVGIGFLKSAIFLNGDIKSTLNVAGIIKDSFTRKDLEYLDTVNLNEKGIGMNSIASTLMVSKTDIAEEIEPYLLRNKLIISTKTGRKITDKGKVVLADLKANA